MPNHEYFFGLQEVLKRKGSSKCYNLLEGSTRIAENIFVAALDGQIRVFLPSHNTVPDHDVIFDLLER